MATERFPADVESALRDIRSATATLIQAAEAEDPERIRRTVARRGEATEKLGTAIEASRATLSEAQRRELRRTIDEALEEQANEAARALRGIMDRARTELVEVARGSRAARGYTVRPKDPSGLDRSG